MKTSLKPSALRPTSIALLQIRVRNTYLTSDYKSAGFVLDNYNDSSLAGGRTGKDFEVDGAPWESLKQ